MRITPAACEHLTKELMGRQFIVRTTLNVSAQVKHENLSGYRSLQLVTGDLVEIVNVVNSSIAKYIVVVGKTDRFDRVMFSIDQARERLIDFEEAIGLSLDSLDAENQFEHEADELCKLLNKEEKELGMLSKITDGSYGKW